MKPFSARELLARVRTTIRLARLRTQHTRWRAAMIDSLQEGFFVGDADGRIVEINAAFTELLGYGADGLPYAQPFPWLPAADTDPEGHRLVLDALARAKAEPTGSFVLPMRHRDGHRVWAATAYNELNDDEGRRRLVGTIRDVTAERYAVQREAALAAMNQRLTGESGVPAVLGAAVDLLRDLWRADRVLAVTWPRIGEPGLTSTDPGDRRWADLDSSVRTTLDRIRSLPALHAATAGAASRHHPRPPRRAADALGGARGRAAARHRGPDAAGVAGRHPRARPAPRAPRRPAARGRPRAATLDPRPRPASRGVRGALRAA